MRLAVVFFQLLIKVKIINLDIAPFVKLVFVDKIKNKKLNIIGLPTYFNENKKLNFVLIVLFLDAFQVCWTNLLLEF